ncbi:MAG TPA: methanogenesis marker 2 protein [Candidatus Methanofastidiosa archaeon]|nr:methanogenesis marker 2 protein [Candidatus Methanofastidiosa archaeon]HPR41212.1 methanogenesis marker 2 protein [Candidatus Methanofastidiosa archaeon]
MDDVISAVRNYDGVLRKNPICKLVNCFADVDDFGKTIISFGDDSAVIKDDEGHYLLFAADGIWKRLMENDPIWAGYCAVLANVNDIYAMGGRPLAMTNILSTTEADGCNDVLKGINMACKKFKVPMVGGHLHPDTSTMSLSVSIVGEAKSILTSFDARPGQDIVVAIDLGGERHKNFFNWDSTSMRSPTEVVGRLEKMVTVAEDGLATAAKDISNPGLLGTIGMLLETSRVGAVVDLDSVPRPDGIDFLDWIRMYPGFGFIMTCDEDNSEDIIELFNVGSVSSCVIGKVTDDGKMTIKDTRSSRTLFDFSKDMITGIRKPEDYQSPYRNINRP